MNSALEFARTVAPLYQAYNWLGLADKPREAAVLKVFEITTENLKHLVEDIDEESTEPTFVSSGRVRVEFWPYDEESNEINFMLDLNTAIDDGTGNFHDLYDPRWDNEA